MDGRIFMIDVLCIGHASFDLNFTVSQHPGSDEKTVASSLVSCGGGPAANAAVAVSRLGYRSAFAGYLGNDVWGERHLQELAQAGVCTDLVARGLAPTPLSVILIQPDGKRALVNYRGGTDYLLAGSIDFSAIVPKVILFDGHEPLLSAPLVQAAKENGIKTVLDAGSVHEGTKALINWVDYLVCSEKFARQFTSEIDEQRAAERLSAYAPHVIITLGERGLIWKSLRDSGHVPAFEVDVVDTTGAGDAFHGAFAACIAASQTWNDTLVYSSAVAALCCMCVGARPGIPNRQQVHEFLQSR